MFFKTNAATSAACAESEDYTAMEQAIEKLEIGDFDKVNYLKVAKVVIGM